VLGANAVLHRGPYSWGLGAFGKAASSGGSSFSHETYARCSKVAVLRQAIGASDVRGAWCRTRWRGGAM